LGWGCMERGSTRRGFQKAAGTNSGGGMDGAVIARFHKREGTVSGRERRKKKRLGP